jgi:hypothetical protein
VNGRQLIRSRQALTLNAAEIYDKAAEYRTQVLTSLRK